MYITTDWGQEGMRKMLDASTFTQYDIIQSTTFGFYEQG